MNWKKNETPLHVSKQKKKKCTVDDIETDDDDYSIHDESDNLEFDEPEDCVVEHKPQVVNENKFVLVKFIRKSIKHFVTLIKKKYEKEYRVKYLKRKVINNEDSFGFILPEKTM